jgi:small subunit ribosomal protein S4
MLNGRRVDIPSIRLKAGDVIIVRPHSLKTHYFINIKDVLKETNQPSLGWLKFDPSKISIEVTGLPTREEAEPDINEQLIVEYYSR